VPQTFQVERKYLNFLCKQLLFLHGFRRFDLDREELQLRNMIVLILDEGQKTTLVSEDGFSDHATVDELREAGMCIISATQTPLSFYAAFGSDKKGGGYLVRQDGRQGNEAVQRRRQRRSYCAQLANGRRTLVQATALSRPPSGPRRDSSSPTYRPSLPKEATVHAVYVEQRTIGIARLTSLSTRQRLARR
jgi:hypothetical protein